MAGLITYFINEDTENDILCSYRIESIDESTLEKVLPIVMQQKIGIFYKLQHEKYPISLRSFALRDIIEAHILIEAQKFFILKFNEYFDKSKKPSDAIYRIIFNILGHTLHINPFPLINERSFNTLCWAVNALICIDLLPYIEINKTKIEKVSIPKIILDKVPNMQKYITGLKQLNESTIKNITELNIPKIKNKYNFQGGIIYIINHLEQKDTFNDFKVAFQEVLINFNVTEIEDIYFKDVYDLIKKYTKDKDDLALIYK